MQTPFPDTFIGTNDAGWEAAAAPPRRPCQLAVVVPAAWRHASVSAPAEIAGHGSGGGQSERGVRLDDADEHIVEHPAVGKQFLSETVVVRTSHGSSFGRHGQHGRHGTGLLCDRDSARFYLARHLTPTEE